VQRLSFHFWKDQNTFKKSGDAFGGLAGVERQMLYKEVE
jgi:hypothetical protein